MDQLIQQVAQRTGMSEDQLRPIVSTVVGLVRDKLPGPAQSMLDQAVGTTPDAGHEDKGSLGHAADAVKGIFKS